MPTEIHPNEEKFRELILYIAAKSSDDPKFGATKLNKLLFVIDQLAYAQLGSPVTGVEYMKLENGPAPRRLVPVRAEMIDQREIVEVEQPYFGFSQKKLVPLRAPRLNLFEPEEIAFIDDLIQMFRSASATEMSEMTHGWRGWRMAQLRETIPYSSFFLSDERPTEYERSRAEELIQLHGWDVR